MKNKHKPMYVMAVTNGTERVVCASISEECAMTDACGDMKGKLRVVKPTKAEVERFNKSMGFTV